MSLTIKMALAATAAALLTPALAHGQAPAAEAATGTRTPAVATLPADGADASTLSGIEVAGRRDPIARVAGGTSVVRAEDLEVKSISNLADALAFTPGVFAQSISGGEGTALSVRGSGLTKGGFTWGNGTQILFDGLPLTTSLGTPYESFEANSVQRIDVYKGANAFEWGATQLGGVINFVQHTGHDADKLFVRLEGGSNNYQRQQVSSGQVLGPVDYYLSFTHFQTEGYRADARASSGRLVGNLGWQIRPDLKTRFFLSYATQFQNNVSGLTWAQLQTDPRQNIPNGTRTNQGSIIVSSRTDWDLSPNSSLELGVQYKKAPLHNGSMIQRTFWDTSDWSAQARYRRNDTLWGRESHTVVSYLRNEVLPDSGATITSEPSHTILGQIRYGGGSEVFLVSNDFEAAPRLWLQTGLSYNRQWRKNHIINALPVGVSPDLEKTYDDVIPRLGVRYGVTDKVEVYGNISRLIEAPQIISFQTTNAGGAYTGFGTTSALRAQKGTSYEVGIKGSTDRLRWDIAYYNETLEDELLTVYTTLPSPALPNGITATTNAAPTIHAGLEAAVEATLWREGDNRLTLRQSYTLNDFRFRDQNLAQGRGVLPRIPRHFYQASLAWNHANGFYSTLDVEAVLSRYPVDFVNLTFAPTYTLLGATVGYADPDGKWRVFAQVKNLTDEVYASSASATFAATPASTVFFPGQGRTFTLGLSRAF